MAANDLDALKRQELCRAVDAQGHDELPNDSAITFTDAEIEVLRRMVYDWVSEGFTAPPYPLHYDDVIDKLGRDG